MLTVRFEEPRVEEIWARFGWVVSGLVCGGLICNHAAWAIKVQAWVLGCNWVLGWDMYNCFPWVLVRLCIHIELLGFHRLGCISIKRGIITRLGLLFHPFPMVSIKAKSIRSLYITLLLGPPSSKQNPRYCMRLDRDPISRLSKSCTWGGIVETVTASALELSCILDGWLDSVWSPWIHRH